MDLDAGHLGFQVRAADLPMHDRLASFAEGFQVASFLSHQDVFNEAKCWPSRLSATETVELAWSTGLLPFGVPLLEELADDRAVEEDRFGTVDWLEPGRSPVQHCVLVNAATGSELSSVVVPVELDYVRVYPALCHSRHLSFESRRGGESKPF
ncbi:hypothetical protein [Sphingomonas daechungensis]|uniref:hypothetical protein n=1 Tax=Sphingomonas daechungensis TaxID=1176646 RepID=UPI0031F0E0B5